jgi:ribonuclease HI
MEYLAENALGIYTDGSSYSRPRRGGVGMLFVWTAEDGSEAVHEEAPPGYVGATNNQMELLACIEALRLLLGKRPPVDPSRYAKITVFTDSTYITNNLNAAKFQWPRRGWTTSRGTPVDNAQLWKELIRQLQLADRAGKRVDVMWVKGHKTSQHNRRADRLAKRSAKTPSSRRVSHVRVRRKKSPRSVEVGSVRMEGQLATIRIISDEYLPVQRLSSTATR